VEGGLPPARGFSLAAQKKPDPARPNSFSEPVRLGAGRVQPGGDRGYGRGVVLAGVHTQGRAGDALLLILTNGFAIRPTGTRWW
jgi:hypothetical protein